MGSLMQSQTESTETVNVGNLTRDHDNNADTGDRDNSGGIVSFDSQKDEHDELLDSMLGDDDFEEGHKEIQHNIDQFGRDPDDEMFETMLSTKKTVSEDKDQYVPDDEMKKLEALLDEGLVDHQTTDVAPASQTIEAMEGNGTEAADLMARELDALLDENHEEEVNFDVQKCEPIPNNTTTTRNDQKKSTTFPSKTKREERIASAKIKVGKEVKSQSNQSAGTSEPTQRKPGVGRFFQKRDSNPTRPKNESIKIKEKSSFGATMARRASNSVRKVVSPGKSKAASSQPKKSIGLSSKDNKSNQSTPPSRPNFTRTTFKRFMSPTIAFKTHIGLAAEDRAAKQQESAKQPPPHKTSWRSSGRTFMSSTFSSLKKLRSASPSSEDKERRRERRYVGDSVNPDGTKSRAGEAFMEPTFSKTMLEMETRIVEERKALEKEEEAKKIIVNLSPWQEDRKPSPFLDYNYTTGTSSDSPKAKHTPKKEDDANDSDDSVSAPPKRRILWTPNNTALFQRRDEAIPSSTESERPTQAVFSPRSHGSLSSQCSIRSFVSPDRAGIIGCQSKYNPNLLKTRGPCELCVFRLSDEDKDELDAGGRHFLVQFTSGGCPNCLEFPRSFDEGPVRLCPKCYAISHRPKQSHRRKKGNDAARIGYTFARTDYA